jgi:formylglycine-generating enzyme required for sulfatase activity
MIAKRSIYMPRTYMTILGGAVALCLLPLGALAEEPPTYLLTNGTTVTDLEMFRECDVCPEMIVMPLGSFMMGATPEESQNPFDIYGDNATGRVRDPDEVNIIPHEHPRHLVEIDIPYAIGRNELTHTEWMRCVNDGGCAHNPDHRAFTIAGYVQLGPDHPVINVSYLDIQDYVGRLNERVGLDVYRLPTEAEWEYAARAGTTTRFAQGDELSIDQANFSRSATEHVLRGQQMPHLVERWVPVPVNALNAANQWGLRHMSGNVEELTLSCWSGTHLGLSTSSVYLEDAQSHACSRRVSKGGGYDTAMEGLRLASRTAPEVETRRHFRGFRLVRGLMK